MTEPRKTTILEPVYRQMLKRPSFDRQRGGTKLAHFLKSIYLTLHRFTIILIKIGISAYLIRSTDFFIAVIRVRCIIGV